jgi:hypothetical protein
MGSFQYRGCLLLGLILPTLCFANGQENKPAALKFDEYRLNFTRPEDEAARLIRFARRLKREPRTQAYIIAYTPRVLNFYGSSHWYIAENRCLTTKAELAHHYDVKESRLICINGGVREAATLELWILPPQASPPNPRPEFQESEIVNCYPIRASGDGYVLRRDSPLKFSAAFSLGNPDIPVTYLWTVTAGKIVAGQGQDSIIVDVREAKEKQVTAEVEVKGLPTDCQLRASYTTVVGVVPYKLSEFEENYSEALQANLDNLTVFLQKESSLQDYIIVYGGRIGRRGYAGLRAERAKYYLTEVRGMPLGRFAILEGGYREKPMFEVWLVPRNGPKPIPTPSVNPHFVEFAGNPRKRKR